MRAMSSDARSASSSVSASTKYEPPSGSAVSVVPASAARICCVRSAIVAARSVGSASASSNEFVWSDWAPPLTADVALRLLRRQRRAAGLCVKAQRQRSRVRGAEAVAHDPGPQTAGRTELRDLLEEMVVRVEEEGQPLPEVVGREPGTDRGFAVRDSVGERERELLRSARSRLADVVPGDRDGVERREPLRAIGEEVGREPHRWARRKDVVATGDVLLQNVVLHGATQLLPRHALRVCNQLVEKKEKSRGSVDRHRRRDAVERDPLEQDFHVGERVDRDPGSPDLALGERIVRVVAELRGQVEGDRQAGLAALEQIAKPIVRILGGAEARVLTNRPRPSAIHRLVRSARVRIRPGRLGLAAGDVGRRVDRLDLDAGVRQPAVVDWSHGAHRTFVPSALISPSGSKLRERRRLARSRRVRCGDRCRCARESHVLPSRARRPQTRRRCGDAR